MFLSCINFFMVEEHARIVHVSVIYTINNKLKTMEDLKFFLVKHQINFETWFATSAKRDTYQLTALSKRLIRRSLLRYILLFMSDASSRSIRILPKYCTSLKLFKILSLKNWKKQICWKVSSEDRLKFIENVTA